MVEWELQGTPDVVHLELADGCKIRSTQKIPGVMCSAGKISSYEDFTVTKLLHGVDVVLGMTWLRSWNPFIDWVQQVLYIRTQEGWAHIKGLFLDKKHQIGTVKLLSDEDLASLESAPDINNFEDAALLDVCGRCQCVDTRAREGGKGRHSKFLFFSLFRSTFFTILAKPAPKKTVYYARVADTVQRKTSSKLAGQRQMLSPKQMQKLMKKGEACYLAIVLPNKTAVAGAVQGSPRSGASGDDPEGQEGLDEGAGSNSQTASSQGNAE